MRHYIYIRRLLVSICCYVFVGRFADTHSSVIYSVVHALDVTPRYIFVGRDADTYVFARRHFTPVRIRRQIFPIHARWTLRCLIVVGRWYVYAATYSSVVNPLYIRRPLRRWVPVGL